VNGLVAPQCARFQQANRLKDAVCRKLCLAWDEAASTPQPSHGLFCAGLCSHGSTKGAWPVIKNCPITTTTGQHLTAVPSSARKPRKSQVGLLFAMSELSSKASQIPSWIPALVPCSFSVTLLSQIPIRMMLHRSFQGTSDLVDRSHRHRYRGTFRVSALHLVPVPMPV
jgi:hypothetical protein